MASWTSTLVALVLCVAATHAVDWVRLRYIRSHHIFYFTEVHANCCNCLKKNSCTFIFESVSCFAYAKKYLPQSP